MTNPLPDVAVTDGPLRIADAIERVSSPEAGGIGVFVGTVRVSAAATDRDQAVVRLEYEAHPTLALEKLEEVVSDATTKWELTHVVAWHRGGACDVGEPTVVIACSATHRAPALEATRWIIDALKATVPIWKKEIYADGSSWVGGEGDGSGAR